MQQHRKALLSLGICQEDGALLRDSPHILEHARALEPSARERFERALDAYDSFHSGKTLFRVAIVGSQGVGKSHFVNNFVPTKEPLLPSKMGARSVTLVPTVLTYGETWGLKFMPRQPDERESIVCSQESVLEAFHKLCEKQQETSRKTITHIRYELTKLVAHQEKIDQVREKLGRAKVEKSKKKLEAELGELEKSWPKSLDFDVKETEPSTPLERITITLPFEHLKGVEIIDCSGYSDKDSDMRSVGPILSDAHCLAVIAPRLPSSLEYNDALERNCMASSLLVVWRWPNESDEVKQRSLGGATAAMEQAYRKRFHEDRHLPYQAEQLIRCASMPSFITDFDSPKLDWIPQAREHHLERLAEWLFICFQPPLTMPVALHQQVDTLPEFQRIVSSVISFYEPTRLHMLTRGKAELVNLILDNILRHVRTNTCTRLARHFEIGGNTGKQLLLQVCMRLDAVKPAPISPNTRRILYEEMCKLWPAHVIQSIVISREQANREKSTSARLEADALCTRYSTFVEASLKDWFLSFVSQAVDCLAIQ